MNNNQNNQNKNVAGPVDPAIISAQIARPADSKQRDDIQEPAKAAPSASQPKVAASVSQAPKDSIESKSSLASAVDQPTKPTRPIAPSKLDTQKAVGVTATDNVEVNLLDSFRQFANTEKMRVQDSRRHRQSADKAVKINDLMKFAKNFKLVTPVPSDLVPILAKDKSKQDEIVERARRNAESLANTGAASKLSVLTDQKSSRPLAPAHWEVEAAAASNNAQNRSTQPTRVSQTSKDRPQAANVPSQAARSQQGLLSHRLADSHRLHKTGTPMSVPNPLPIQDARQPSTRPAASGSGVSSPHGPGGVRSPSSSTSARFNVKATEFKPNPTASTFKPTAEPSLASSPRTDTNTRSGSRAPSPSAFFGDRKLVPVAERASILSHFDILKHLKDEAENDPAAKNWVSNGGIKPSYKTPPTWTTPTDPEKPEDFKSYKEMFDKARPVPAVTPQHSSPVNPALAHQHQLPLHLQNGPQGIPQVQTPQQPPQLHAQPQHYATGPHHYDDHYMRPSISSASVYPAPSPRMQNNNIAYPSPMNNHAQLAYGQPIPQYMLGPNGPQQAGFRQFPGGPQMMASPGPHLAPMMVQQPSAGGYMVHPQQMIPFNPQMTMYPGAGPQPYGVPTQSPSGYPSPGRGAPMMMHQGSHQGQPVYMTPSQYGQPIYAQQPPAHSE